MGVRYLRALCSNIYEEWVNGELLKAIMAKELVPVRLTAESNRAERSTAAI